MVRTNIRETKPIDQEKLASVESMLVLGGSYFMTVLRGMYMVQLVH